MEDLEVSLVKFTLAKSGKFGLGHLTMLIKISIGTLLHGLDNTIVQVKDTLPILIRSQLQLKQLKNLLHFHLL